MHKKGVGQLMIFVLTALGINLDICMVSTRIRTNFLIFDVNEYIPIAVMHFSFAQMT